MGSTNGASKLAAEIGKRLKAARARRGISQMRLAGECEVEPYQISNWERGVNMPTIPSLLKLCRALHTTLDDLCPVEAQEVARHTQ